jgi:hypothetical protein
MHERTSASVVSGTLKHGYSSGFWPVQDQTLYVGTRGALRAMDFDGNEVWTYHLKGSDVDISSGPVVARSPQRQAEQPLVFFGTQGGSLRAIQARVRLRATTCACTSALGDFLFIHRSF